MSVNYIANFGRILTDMFQVKEVSGRSLINGSVTLSSGGLAFCADVVSLGIIAVSKKEECSISFFFCFHSFII